MKGGFALLGTFKGRFYTHQKVSLTGTEVFPLDQSHQVTIYAAEFHDAVFRNGLDVVDFQRLGSMVLEQVPHVIIHPCSEGGFEERRIYTLTELVLIQPKIRRAGVIGDKTYGEIEAHAFGKTEAFGQIVPIDGEDIEFTTPPLVDEDYDKTASPLQPEENSGTNHTASGCAGLFLWIFSIFRSTFLMFLLLLLGMVLFKSCNEEPGNGCKQKVEAERQLVEERMRLDRVQSAYDLNLERALAEFGTVYFFQNSTDFHPNSMGNNSPINRIFNLIEAYDDKHFVIEGFHSGRVLEPMERLDSLRAVSMCDTLSQMGIAIQRLHIQPRGDEILPIRSRLLDDFYVGQNLYRQYNRNMRVVVKVEPNHE